MFMILGAALASEAGGGALIETPLGSYSKWAVEGICMSPKLKIATVVGLEPYWKPFIIANGVVHSKDPMTRTTMKTEAHIRGRKEATFKLELEGGPFGNVWYPTSANAPQPVLGGRYLVGMAEYYTPRNDGAWPNGTNLVIATFELDPQVTPSTSEEEIRHELEAFCESI